MNGYNNNNNNFISSILLIVVLHVYNGNKRHIKEQRIINMFHTIKSVKVLIKNRCKVSYANVSNPQISCARTASVLG